MSKPSIPDFATSTATDWLDADFWSRLCPELTVESTVVEPSLQPPIVDANLPLKRRHALRRYGFVLVDEPMDSDDGIIDKLRRGVERLNQHGFPASCILVYHETWQLAWSSYQSVLSPLNPDYAFQFDILAWYIDSHGFSPHRDRQPDNVAASFTKDEDAHFVTHWIALSDATPETSCLYVIPRTHDPGYSQGDLDDVDPLHRALPNKPAYQHIRALPRSAGQSLVFTHRLIHWGSARAGDCTAPPRIALSFVASHASFEQPYVSFVPTLSVPAPPLHLRVLLVCAQLLIYYQRFDLTPSTLHQCYAYCKRHAHDLEATYRQKVFYEYVHAMQEAKQVPTTDTASNHPTSNKAAENSDQEEDILEEMLNAEKAGVGEFEDDFDELNNDDDEEAGNKATYSDSDEDIDNDEIENDGDSSCDDDDEKEHGVTLFGNVNGGDAKRRKVLDS
jgi:hypothetical protein